MDPSRILALAVALALSACEPYYAYEPVTEAYGVAPGEVSGDVVPRSGGTTASYSIPPHGDLRLASYGLVDVGPRTQSGERLLALHLRMTLSNEGDSPMTMDTRLQRVELEGYGTSVAAFASADPGTPPPTITVPPKGKRVVDLFFPLPAALQKADRLPSFDAVWRVESDEGGVAGRTPFELMAVQPAQAYDAAYDYGPDYYWGPPYWYNPYYAGYGFVGAVVIPPLYFGYPLYVHRHAGYGHFARHGYYHYRGYPRPGHHGAYPHGYPHWGYPQGGYPHHYYRGYPGGRHPGGGYPGYPGSGHHGGHPGGGHHGGHPGGHPGGGHPGGGHHGGGGHGGGGHGGGRR